MGSLCKWIHLAVEHIFCFHTFYLRCSLCTVTWVRFGSSAHLYLTCWYGIRLMKCHWVQYVTGRWIRRTCRQKDAWWILKSPFDINVATEMSLPSYLITMFRYIYICKCCWVGSNKEIGVVIWLNIDRGGELEKTPGVRRSRITSLITIQNRHIIASYFHTVWYTVRCCAAMCSRSWYCSQRLSQFHSQRQS